MQNDVFKPEKIWNKTFISIFLTNMLLYLGQQMVQTMLSKFTASLGATASIVGIVASLYAAVALVMKIISAPAIDTFNPKYILSSALCVMCISFFGYSLSRSVSVVIVFRLLQGLGQAFTATCCLAMASNALPTQKMGQGIGYFALSQSICQAIAPTLGLKIADNFGFRIMFVVAACFMLIGAIVALNIKMPYQKNKKFKISLDRMIAKEAIIPAILMMFLCTSFSVVSSFMVLWGTEQGVGKNISLYFTVYAVTLLFTRPFIGKLSDKFGTIKVLIPAICCFGGSFLLVSVSNTIWMFLLAAFISAFGFGVCQPTMQALCMRLVPKERRGAGSCTSYIGNDIGFFLGPIVAGALVDKFGYATMWRLMLVPMIVAALLAFAFRKKLSTNQG